MTTEYLLREIFKAVAASAVAVDILFFFLLATRRRVRLTLMVTPGLLLLNGWLMLVFLFRGGP